MHKKVFYFNEALTRDDMNSAINQIEESLNSANADQLTSGIVRGFTIPTAHATWNMTIGSGVAIEIGTNARTVFSGATTDISVDHAGGSTLPSSGKYRWVTVAILYGQHMFNSAVDGLGNTVYTVRRDSWNKLGTTVLADATAAANNAGAELLYVVAGAEATIGSALTFPSVPVGANILCDVLITNGETEINFSAGAVYYGRRPIAHKIATSPMGFPGDAGISRFDYQLLWEIEGRSIKTRFYQGTFGMVITTNALWTPNATTPVAPAGTWVADNTGYYATKYTLFDGIVAERKFAADTGTPWTDAAQSTSGWDSYAEIGRDTARSTYMLQDGNGDITGKGVIVGYVSQLSPLGTGGLVNGTAIQFPRKFASTPSSVTTVSSGTEINVTSVAISNLSVYGADVTTTQSSAGFKMQRTYTATQ